jgi:hypothetical protein
VNLNVHEIEHKKPEENIQRKKNNQKNLAKNEEKHFFFKINKKHTKKMQ